MFLHKSHNLRCCVVGIQLRSYSRSAQARGTCLSDKYTNYTVNCHHVIMSSCHHIIMSSCHHVIMSYHHVIMSSCHHVCSRAATCTGSWPPCWPPRSPAWCSPRSAPPPTGAPSQTSAGSLNRGHH